MHRIMCIVIGGLAAVLVVIASPALAKPDCGSNTGKTASGTPIPIGAVTTNSGLASFETADQSVQAYFDCVNANGGIHGRRLVYRYLDDQSKLDVAAQAAKKLIDDDGIYAMVGNASIIECAVNGGYYLKSNVLEVGLGVPSQCYTSKNIGPVSAGPRLGAISAVDFMRRKAGAKSVVCVIAKFPGSDYICGGVELWGKKYGVKVTSIYYDPSSVDFNSMVLQILATGADAVQAVLVDDQAAQLLNSAQQQDGAAKMKWTGPTAWYTARFLGAIDIKYWNDRIWINTELGPLDAKGQDNRNWHAVMEAYGPQVRLDSFSQAGYITARIAVKAMLSIKDPAKINRNTVTAAIQNVKPYPTDILCQPWYWGGASATEHNANHVTRTVTIHEGKFKRVEGCWPSADPALASIEATEKKLGNQDH